MKMTLTACDFVEHFERIRLDQFTRAGLFALFEHLEEMEDATGEEMEFDCVAICCEFSESENFVDWAAGYFSDWTKDLGEDLSGPSEDESEDEFSDRADSVIRDYIESNGTLIEFNGGIIVSSF